MKLAILLSFTAMMSAIADLKFEKRMNSYTAKPEEERFTSTFNFKNASKVPIEIKKVDSDCGCVKAEADKSIYKPGESGKITAVYSIGSNEGTQNKTLWVVYAAQVAVLPPPTPGTEANATPAPAQAKPATENPEAAVDDPNAGDEATEAAPPPVQPKTEKLTVSLTIPSIMEISPKITKWKQDDQPESKTVTIEMKHEKPIKIREVRSSRDTMKVELKTLEEGKRYELHLKPDSTKDPQLGMLTIMTDCEIPKHEKKLAFFTIERAAPPVSQP